nr:MAG TPA: hypothetical protein [Caudoviricetes sp.]
MPDEIKKTSPSEDILKELEEQEVAVNQPTAETPAEVTESATGEVEKEEVIQPEVVEEVKETPAIEEGKEEKKDEKETKLEEPPTEEIVEEEPPTEEAKEEPEVIEEQVDVDAIRAELEELKAEKAEAAEVEALGKENARVANEFNQLCQGLGKGLEEAFEKYAIPTDKTIEELEKEDPAKAQLARNLTKQANDIIEAAKKDAEAFLNEKAHEVVFKKADRLLQKMDISEEEAPIVAETFLDIIAQAGIKDLHDDLKAKLELAVAKAKMVVKAAGKTVDVVKTAADVVKEHVDKVADKIEKVEEIISDRKDTSDKKEIKEEPKEEEKPEEKVPSKPEPPKVVEEIDRAEFEEGVGSKSEPASGINVDNVLEKMAALPFKDRNAFYKEHFALVEEALRRGA